MKIKLLSLLAFIPVFLITNASYGQATVLVPGDIVIFHHQADTPDDFAFVTFVDINEGTGIFFTDCGASSTGFPASCNEGAVKYTAPTGGLNAGDIVRFSTNGANFANYSDSVILGGSGMALSASGDQVVAFQDNTDAAGGSSAATTPVFLFVNHNGSTAFSGNPTDSNQTGLPPGLSDTMAPITALGLGTGTGPQDEWDNTIYDGTFDFSGFATTAEAITAAKAAFTNIANYGARANSIFDTDYEAAVMAIPNALNLTTLSNNEFTSKSFSLYPNPTSGNVTIRNAGFALQNVTVTDVNGRTVASYQMNGTTGNADLSLNLNTGLYFVKLTTENASTTKKLIIN
ncbi:MAG: T9SS type A sorting domain-containing protein [Bacteroidota bacterium]